MKYFSKHLLAIFITISCCLFFGCKKTNTLKATVSYDFSWKASEPYIGEEFHFESTAPDSSTFLWNFGDGNTSTVAYPTHVFTTTNTFTVTLIINEDNAQVVSHNISIGTNPDHQFDYIGYPSPFGIGDTVYFVSSVGNDSTFLWNFGDGATSTMPTPYHIYSTSGTFLLQLLINGRNQAKSKYPNITIYANPGYTHIIAGEKLWHGTERYKYDVFGSDVTTSNLPDSAFSFSYINSVTISLSHNELVYNPDSSKGNVLFFTYGDNSSVDLDDYERVYFNSVTDSINFYSRSYGGGLISPVYSAEYFWHTP